MCKGQVGGWGGPARSNHITLLRQRALSGEGSSAGGAGSGMWSHRGLTLLINGYNEHLGGGVRACRGHWRLGGTEGPLPPAPAFGTV